MNKNGFYHSEVDCPLNQKQRNEPRPKELPTNINMTSPYCIDCACSPVEANGRCASCNHAHRKSLRDSTKALLKGKPQQIAKISPRRKERIKPYPVFRREFLNEHPVCEVHFDGCDGNSSELHHCSFSELDLMEPSTIKAVCRPCHNHIEFKLSSEERRAKGLLVDPVNTKWEERLRKEFKDAIRNERA